VTMECHTLQWALEEYIRTKGKRPHTLMKPSPQLPFSQENINCMQIPLCLTSENINSLFRYTQDICCDGMDCQHSTGIG
jgi:hypothetical protein